MNESEPDYENPSVVRINSIAIGLWLCFILTLVLAWFSGRSAESPVERPPEISPTPAVDPVAISTPSVVDIRTALIGASVDRGAELFRGYGCVNCHTLDGGASSGPPLNGVRGRTPETYKFPESYLMNVILDPPGREQQGGYTNLMPSNYDELLSAQDVADLVVFLMEQ